MIASDNNPSAFSGLRSPYNAENASRNNLISFLVGGLGGVVSEVVAADAGGIRR